MYAIRSYYEQVQKNFRIHGGLEDGALFLKLFSDDVGVDQITVVGQGIGAVPVVHHKRLGIGQNRFSGGRVPDMADGRPALNAFKVFHVENFRYKPHAFMGVITSYSIHYTKLYEPFPPIWH